MGKPLRVLVVEDSEDDVLLTIRALKQGGYDPVCEQVETAEALRNSLHEKLWDIILCDYQMPQFNGLAAIALLKETTIDIPLIIVSGVIGEETAAECMRSGAHDYVKKDNLSRLVPAIERELKEAESRSQRKQAEEAQRQSEDNFRRSLDESPFGVRIVTVEGETVYANQAFLDIYGYDSIEELKNTPVEKRYTPESHTGFLIRREKRRQGIDIQSEYTVNIVRKNGEVRYLQVFRKEILWNGERQFQVIYQDITERMLADEALRKSEERYRDIFDKIVEGIYRTTPEGRFSIINPAFARICGYASPEEMMEKVTDIANQLYANPEDRSRFQKLIAAEGEVKGFEVQFKHPTKELVWVSINSRALRDEQGNIRHYDGTIEDITERKQAEEGLKDSRLQFRALAARQQQIREEMMIMIAREIHDDLGGGLTGLKMDLSWLLRKMDDTEAGEKRVALIDKIHTSNALIDQMIRAVRRISTDLRPSILDDLGLVAALEWQLSEFTSRTEIPHEFTTTLEYVNLEETTAVAVFRIFQEALTNVARHSEATKVVIVLREGERSLFGDEGLVLEIRDNGRGITEEKMLHPESLGLLGMKERVLAFGGELSIRGEPGGGTVLVLKIPRIQGETQ
jgi:PAS domain S-box-containing protein